MSICYNLFNKFVPRRSIRYNVGYYERTGSCRKLLIIQIYARVSDATRGRNEEGMLLERDQKILKII